MSPTAPLARHRSWSLSLKRSRQGEGAEVRLRGSKVSSTDGAQHPAQRPGRRVLAPAHSVQRMDMGWEETKTFLNTPKGGFFIYSQE